MLVFERKGAAEFDGVHLESLQHVLIDDGKLLDGVIDADGFLGQAEVIAQAGVGHGGDAGGAVARQVNRHAIGLLVVQCGEDSFA